MADSNALAETKNVADRYIAVWNEPDAESRRQAVAALWTEDGTYTDPLAVVEGHEALAAMIIGVREQFPGLVLRLLGDIDAHHDVARFGWELVPEGGGESLVVGFDVAVVAAYGRLRNVYGFLDKGPTD